MVSKGLVFICPFCTLYHLGAIYNAWWMAKVHDAKVTIDKYVWLGSNYIVLPEVHIGEGAVCCAGCVVIKDVEPYTVVA